MMRLLVLLALWAFPVFAQPNVVLILADDFSMNLVPTEGPRMPALRKMMRDGMTLTNFYTVNSLCCPSRASMMTGKLPHNTGVQTNGKPFGGLDAFNANGNEAVTFGVALQAAGYDTAFLGKYLNGYKPENQPIPIGWDEWASTSRGYIGYGYTLNHNGVISTPDDHFTDKISRLGRDWIEGRPGPWFMELAAFAPHSPYTPPVRYEASFLDAALPETPAFGARPDATAPQWLQDIPPLKAPGRNEMRADYILRVQASEGIDDMIAAVRRKVGPDTYVIFTSDNGYHMGEMSMRTGKMTPFDFDSRVPFVIVGPGITAGSVSDEITSNVDIYPTLLEWAGAPVPTDIDGVSMVPVFSGGSSGRTMAVIEHLQDPIDPDDPDTSDVNPPTYTALRGDGWLYVEYETGEVGYYTDPHQLYNIPAPPGLAAVVAAIKTCSGAGCVR